MANQLKLQKVEYDTPVFQPKLMNPSLFKAMICSSPILNKQQYLGTLALIIKCTILINVTK